MHTQELLSKLHQGDRRALARVISLVENDSNDSEIILEQLQIDKNVPVIGITGPPGAGKSTLVSALASHFLSTKPGSKVAILAIDPSSPYTQGSLLGDRLRMTEHFNNPHVFIRSLATRGALGGLSAKTIEITDVLKSAGFDYIIIETVGVGQSEVEIAALAETTVVVFVP
ncbi:MAG TPA: GTP-binding protein, partial [Bacteroidia bacterium]|nr:GTP-binding protein [Bacteroidia bacterium]